MKLAAFTAQYLVGIDLDSFLGTSLEIITNLGKYELKFVFICSFICSF
jgi:hypothetical protein